MALHMVPTVLVVATNPLLLSDEAVALNQNMVLSLATHLQYFVGFGIQRNDPR